jgi:hypothetical protein
MKFRLFFVLCVVLALCSSSFLAAQNEPVEGNYDPENDWFVFEYVSPELGKRQVIYDPANKVAPTIIAEVTWDDNTNDYAYRFAVENGAKGKQVLDKIIIKFSSSIYSQSAPNDEWRMGEYRSGRTDTWKWTNTKGEPSGIAPGTTVDGFSYRSKGVPSIIDVFFFGERRVRFSGPSPTYDSDELRESFDRVYQSLLSQYPEADVTVKRKVLGPATPPAELNPVDFLDNIIDMKHEAFSLGWITNKGIERSLDAKLDAARKKLSAGDYGTARNILTAFVNEVEAQGCESHDDCSKGKHLLPEAYALLKYNAQYLADNLK